ncbi:MAG TPA: DUF2247 family protein [Mycobacteriales bacterium]|jgi:hypothetical protein|nr:DUF2247 family protein [Mycobacteriales bacterium]
MTLFELPAAFIIDEDIPLDAQDLAYGLHKGFLKQATAIDIAVNEVNRGASDPVLRELAGLLREEKERVSDLLMPRGEPHPADNLAKSSRKWLYLQLKAAYSMQERLSDPLGVIEQLYADFDYPPTIASFVRYMPLAPGQEAGEAGLGKRWVEFLDREHASLTRRADNPNRK